MSVLDLFDSKLVVVGRDGDIAAVDDFEPGEEGVDSKGYVVAAVQSQTTRACADACWTESGTGTVRGAGVLIVRLFDQRSREK